MTYKVIIRPAAEDDLAEAIDWHEERQVGLGKRLLAHVNETISKLAERPDLFGIVVHKQLRRANVRRFPYGVFYQIMDQSIIVVAVLHARRAPRRWKSRVE